MIIMRNIQYDDPFGRDCGEGIAGEDPGDWNKLN